MSSSCTAEVISTAGAAPGRTPANTVRGDTHWSTIWPCSHWGLSMGVTRISYSVDGGPRRDAEDCTQGACFIYEGYDQPIEVYAAFEDCSESILFTRGAACTDASAAELIFAFYPCDGDTDTDGAGSTG